MDDNIISTQQHQNTLVLAKGASIALVGKIIGRGLQLVIQVLLARWLGPVQYGLYVIGLTVFQIGQQIGLMGFDNGVIHFGSQALRKNNKGIVTVLRSAQLFTLGSALLISCAIYILSSWLAVSVFHHAELTNVLRGFSIAIVFAVELKVIAAATRLSQKMHFSVLAEDILPFIVSLALVMGFFFFLKLSLLSAVVAVAIGFGIGWLLANYFLRKLFRPVPLLGSVSMQLAKDFFVFSMPTFLAVMFVYLLYGSTIFIISYFRSPQEVGVYQAASQLSTLSVIILVAFNAIFTPMIPKLYQESRKIELNELYKVSTKWGLYISMPVLLVVLLLPRQLLEILYGQVYLGGVWPLVILTLAQAINTGTGAVGFLLVMSQHQNNWLLLAVVSTLIGFVLNLWLIPQWGIIGAALANACSVAILYLSALFQAKALLGLWPYDKRYWKGAASAGISAGVALLLLRVLSVSPFLQVLLITLGIIFSFLLSLLVFGLDQEDVQIFRLISNRLGFSIKL